MEIAVIVGLLMFFGLPVVLMSELTPENIHRKTGLTGEPPEYDFLRWVIDLERPENEPYKPQNYYRSIPDEGTEEMEQKLADMRAGIARIMGYEYKH